MPGGLSDPLAGLSGHDGLSVERFCRACMMRSGKQFGSLVWDGGLCYHCSAELWSINDGQHACSSKAVSLQRRMDLSQKLPMNLILDISGHNTHPSPSRPRPLQCISITEHVFVRVLVAMLMWRGYFHAVSACMRPLKCAWVSCVCVHLQSRSC